MSEPLNLDLKIRKGTTFSQEFVWEDSTRTPYNLTGYSARAQIRQTIDNQTVLLELNSSSGTILLGTTGGNFEITIPASTTSQITWNNAVYDFQMISPDDVVITLLAGIVVVTSGVTR